MMFLSTWLVFRELGFAYCLVAKVPYNDNDLWYRPLQLFRKAPIGQQAAGSTQITAHEI
jgi:hypothetical protein